MTPLQIAQNFVGKSFKFGHKFQCAAFVTECLEKGNWEGIYPRNPDWVPDWSGADNGQPIATRIPMDKLTPGDLVIFGRTFGNQTSEHIGMYEGNGKFIHRPSFDGVVERADLHTPFWNDRFEVGLDTSSQPSGKDFRIFKHTQRPNAHSLLIDGKPDNSRVTIEIINGKSVVTINNKQRNMADLQIIGKWLD